MCTRSPSPHCMAVPCTPALIRRTSNLKRMCNHRLMHHTALRARSARSAPRQCTPTAVSSPPHAAPPPSRGEIRPYALHPTPTRGAALRMAVTVKQLRPLGPPHQVRLHRPRAHRTALMLARPPAKLSQGERCHQHARREPRSPLANPTAPPPAALPPARGLAADRRARCAPRRAERRLGKNGRGGVRDVDAARRRRMSIAPPCEASLGAHRSRSVEMQASGQGGEPATPQGALVPIPAHHPHESDGSRRTRSSAVRHAEPPTPVCSAWGSADGCIWWSADLTRTYARSRRDQRRARRPPVVRHPPRAARRVWTLRSPPTAPGFPDAVPLSVAPAVPRPWIEYNIRCESDDALVPPLPVPIVPSPPPPAISAHNLALRGRPSPTRAPPGARAVRGVQGGGKAPTHASPASARAHLCV